MNAITSQPRRPRSAAARAANIKAKAATRLEVHSRVTGALTHDFNNLLTIVLSGVEQLSAGLEPGSDEHRLALTCLAAAERGSSLLQRILSLSEPRATPPETVNCVDAIEAAIRFLRPMAPKAAEIWTSVPHPVCCYAGRADLEMALLNLCINAADATPQGGKIIVAARPMMIGAGTARRLDVTPGRYAKLSVSDTGAGMSPETLARAKEPFFTTKTDTGGTGLGLVAVHDFARAAGGALELTSREGEGTQAMVYIPVDGSSAVAAPVEVAA